MSKQATKTNPETGETQTATVTQIPAKKTRKSNGPRAQAMEPREFVIAWQKAETLEGFCEATSMTKIAAKGRAERMREKGVRLKELSSGGSGVRFSQSVVDDLNSLID